MPDVIREIREKRQLQQADCAAALGVTQQQYSRLERGIRSLKVSQLYVLADLFRCQPSDLLPPQRQSEGDTLRDQLTQLDISCIRALREILLETGESDQAADVLSDHEKTANRLRQLLRPLIRQEQANSAVPAND